MAKFLVKIIVQGVEAPSSADAVTKVLDAFSDDLQIDGLIGMGRPNIMLNKHVINWDDLVPDHDAAQEAIDALP